MNTDLVITGAGAGAFALALQEAGQQVVGPLTLDETNYWALRVHGPVPALPEGVTLIDPEVAATIHSWM